MIAADPIAREEFGARIARVREGLAEAGLDALICYGAHVDYAPGALRYLADWFCIEEEQAMLVVLAAGPVVLVTDSAADLDRAREQAVCDEVAFAAELGPATASRLRGCDVVGLTGGRVLPAPAMDGLRAAVRVQDASPLTAELRMVKSGPELALLREAARISDLGMQAGLVAVHEGGTEVEMAAAAEHAIRRAGAELSFGGGRRAADGARNVPPRRAADAGRAGGRARLRRARARLSRRHVPHRRGRRAPGGARSRAGVRRRGRRGRHRRGAAGRDSRRAPRGGPCGGVGCRPEGRVVGRVMPHGAGTGQHEPPYGDRDPARELRAGMVLCIEPGVLLPGTGGVVHERMIAVTPDRAEVLNRLPLRMWAPVATPPL